MSRVLVCAISIAAAFPFPARAPAATPPPVDLRDVGRPSLRQFTSKDGLPQNAITCIIQDRAGLLWIGTKDGAARYDGRTWLPYPMPPETGLNGVNAILESGPGDMWFGTMGGGAVHVAPDGAHAVFTTRDGLPSDNVLGLAQVDEPGRPNTLLAVTDSGVARFQGDRWEAERVALPASNRHSYLRPFHTSTIASGDGVREVWVSTGYDTVARLREGAWTVYRGVSDSPGDLIHSFGLTSAFEGEPKLLVSRSHGLSWFDGTSWHPLENQPADKEFVNVGVMCDTVAPDGTHSFWVGATGGLYRYTKGVWTKLDAQAGIPAIDIWSLYATGDEGRTHALWVGSAGGGLLRMQLGLWTAYDRRLGMPSDSIYGMLVTHRPTHSDALWLATIAGGLVRIADGRTETIQWPGREDTNWVTCLLDDSTDVAERVWAARSESLLELVDGRPGRVFDRDHGMRDMGARCLSWVNTPGGREMWIGAEQGLKRLVGDRIEPAPPNLELPGAVTCILADTNVGNATAVYIGTDRGLAVYDGKSTKVYGMKDGFPSNAILCVRWIARDEGKRELWIGTRAGAVVIDSDHALEAVFSTSTTPALPNNTVYRIEQDGAGRIYLATNRGVVRLARRAPTSDDRSQFDEAVYTTEDGLPNDECNTGASFADYRGRIWFGTLAGAAMFDPAAEVAALQASPLRLQRGSVVDEDGRPLVSGESLAYDASHLVFEYALLCYNREGAIRYRTQLVGLDRTPLAWTATSRREFTSLPAGSYTLRIWGRDAYGNVSGPLEIPFIVRPAPLLSWWAYLVYVLMALAIAAFVIKYRERSLRRHNAQLAAAIDDRTAELAHTVQELRVSQTAAVESERHALDANLAKSVFLANMSHELRTPLNAVLGFAQLMDRSSALSASDRHQLGIIRRSGEHLLTLINDVLSLAKIEAGKLDLRVHPFSPSELFAATEAMMRLRAEAKDLRLDFDIDDSFPLVVDGDDGKLRQVLINLVGNAVKFTDRGHVRLIGAWQDGVALFSIEDTGRGIAKGEVDRLFRAFSQTESGRAIAEGSGLGLAICREIIHAMGGEIEVQSHEGAGTTFRFHVAMPRTASASLALARRRVVGLAPGERRRRMLVVDDSYENRLLLVTLLTSVGFDVREAENGRDAIEIARAWRPRVVFMDHRMPVMDGKDATRAIRRFEEETGCGENRMLIISTTASVFESERAEILENGADELVFKPFQESEIFEALERLAGIRFSSGASVSAVNGPCVVRDEFTDRLRSVGTADRRRLQDALHVGDTQAAEAVARDIAVMDEDLGDELTRRIRAFEIDRLLATLEEMG